MIFLDLETTANGGPDGDSPEAHWKSNKVLLCGWKTPNFTRVALNGTVEYLCDYISDALSKDGYCTLVAHNAKFDLKYLMRDRPDVEWEKVKVWDTMTWEYLDSGHRDTFVSLEDTASKYGIPFTKSLDLGALLSSGIKMEDIPKEELEEYLKEDVKVLEKIWQVQEQCATYWMDYILPLAEMELNGLPLSIGDATDLATDLQENIDESYEFIRDYIMDKCQWQDGSIVGIDDFSNMVTPKGKYIKCTANRTLSFLLTGEPKQLNITQKWKLSLKGQPLLNNNQVQRIYQDIDPTHLGYPMDEETIEKVHRAVGGKCDMLDHLMRHRKATKVVGTYLLPMLQQANIDGTVHPKLNTTVTRTGRLSSSEPNGQNMPEEVRKLIEVQNEYHQLEEVDFSQLEMVGAACLSGDKALIYDLNHGVDVHENTATKVFGAAQAKAKRKLAKNVNFGVLYGGKAPGLSKQTGVEQDTIKKLIDAFYTSYPGVARWQRKVFEDVVDNMEAHDVKDGEQRYHSDYTLPVSARKFRFIETESPLWVRRKTGRGYSFSPNHTANYPIQGFTGGDIVMYGLWYLWTVLRNRVKFRMTVHDSILLERELDVDLHEEYDDMISAIEKRFNLPVHLHVDVESGYNWR